MVHTDRRGNPCSSSSTAAQAAVEQALWRLMSFYDTPVADLESATQHDPSWAMPHALRAGFLYSLTEPAMRAEAAGHLAQAQALAASATPREQAHLAALQQVKDDRWQTACGIWDAVLIDHPRDALALQWAHLFDLYRGDAAALRQRPARALPEWDEADPLHPYVLALYAFGLEECNLYPQAEETGRRALAANPRVPWAMHAVAHVMEMQGRFEEGSAWLRQQHPQWADDNGFACHLWWHKGLFRLEALDLEGVLRLVDQNLSGAALQITLHRLDTSALLWRMHLLGQDVSGQYTALLDGWPLDDESAGDYSFNDLHVVLALLGAGRISKAEGWVARCAQRALASADASRSNHRMAREVGLPLMRGLLAMARGQADSACDLIGPVRAQTWRMGGSHAQRDLVDQSLLAAASQAGRFSLGRALLNERVMAKAITPLTRHWAAAVGEPP